MPKQNASRSNSPSATCDDELEAARLTGGGTGHDREHDERHRVGDHGRADRGGDRPVGREAHAADGRVGHQRVRREERAEQDRGAEFVSERRAADEPERHRDRERDQREQDRVVAVAREHGQVEVEAGHEHQVQQADVAELLHDAAAALHHVEHVRADDHPADEQSDQPGHVDALREPRRDDDHDDRDQQLPRRAFGSGQMQQIHRIPPLAGQGVRITGRSPGLLANAGSSHVSSRSWMVPSDRIDASCLFTTSTLPDSLGRTMP